MSAESRSVQKDPEPACPVQEMTALFRKQLHSLGEEDKIGRGATAAVLRLLVELSLGRGRVRSLEPLLEAAARLSVLNAPLARALTDSISARQSEWEAHLTGKCDKGCFARHVPPCQQACPAHIDIPGMMARVGAGEFDKALEVLYRDTPLPNSCGLVCPAPCERSCVHLSVSGKPVFIRPMKHVAAEYAKKHPHIAVAPATGKRVAVVGCGPAGLTAAYYLAQMGHAVEIFDERENPGGVMRYGIPEYRLPNEKLYAEVDAVKALGVGVHLGHRVNDALEFKKSGFDATVLATGMQRSRGIGVPGDDAPFVLGGMNFLSAVRSGKAPKVGPYVAVIGGGNVAIDVAMTALRCGAKKVQMWYRRSRAEMPANPHEVELALEEGVEIVEYWAPKAVYPGNNIEFSRSRYAPDFNPEKEQTTRITCDQVIAGVGQIADLSFLAGSAVREERGVIVCDPVTLKTGEDGVFAAGDIAHGTKTAVAAIGSGKRAAVSVDAYLRGITPDFSSVECTRRDLAPFLGGDPAFRTSDDRQAFPEHDPLVRRQTFAFIQDNWDPKTAALEAQRCLRCDQCIGCGLCEAVCAEQGTSAIRMTDCHGRTAFVDLPYTSERCIGCGACAGVCPTGAITVTDTPEGERLTSITGSVVCRQALEKCTGCGKPLGTAKQSQRTGALWQSVCTDCRRKKAAAALQGMARL